MDYLKILPAHVDSEARPILATMLKSALIPPNLPKFVHNDFICIITRKRVIYERRMFYQV